MTGKMKLYIGLLVLGIALVGGGLWFLLSNTPTSIDVPEGKPVIAMNIINPSRGTEDQMAIYEDGTVIHRQTVAGNQPMTIWRSGHLQEEEMANLIAFFRDSGFDELDAYYQSPAAPDPEEGQGTTDFIVAFDYGEVDKTVRAFGYLTPIGGITPPDMPYPLEEIHQMLNDIAENRTEEVYRQTPQPSGGGGVTLSNEL